MERDRPQGHRPAAGLYPPAVGKSSHHLTASVSLRQPHAVRLPTGTWSVPHSTDSVPPGIPAPTHTPNITQTLELFTV